MDGNNKVKMKGKKTGEKMKNLNKQVLFILCVMGCFGNAFAQNIGAYENVDFRDSVIVCRSKDCRPAKSTMTKEFLYNKLTSLLKNNINRRVELCEADPLTRVCISDAIAFDALVGATHTQVTLPSLYILDAKGQTDLTTTDFVADYELQVGETFPKCQAALNQLYVECANNIFIETPEFSCHFTNNGTTRINAAYAIDYVDLDYGIIGADYTIGLDQTSQGGQSGYVVMRFANAANGANELTPRCHCDGCDERKPLPCDCQENGQKDEVMEQTIEQPVQQDSVPAVVQIPTEQKVTTVETIQVINTEPQQVLDPHYPVVTEVEEF